MFELQNTIKELIKTIKTRSLLYNVTTKAKCDPRPVISNMGIFVAIGNNTLCVKIINFSFMPKIIMFYEYILYIFTVYITN